MITFSDSEVVPGSTKYADTGACFTWQNDGDRVDTALALFFH